jgi:hypothetical protein
MTRGARIGVAAAVTVGALMAVRLASFVPYTAERDVGAVLRLAWRARGERVNECRRLTPGELARLPVHMRQEEVCEGRLLPYRLVVSVDGVPAVDRLVHGAGAREDRPLYVFEDLPLRPGPHRLAVRFTLVGAATNTTGAAGPPATPPRLALDTTVDLGSRRIVLVTYDDAREQLVVRRGSTR